MNKIRVRFGFVNIVPFFKNMGVFVIWMPETKFHELYEKVREIKTLLMFSGNEALAAKLLCEQA